MNAHCCILQETAAAGEGGLEISSESRLTSFDTSAAVSFSREKRRFSRFHFASQRSRRRRRGFICLLRRSQISGRGEQEKGFGFSGKISIRAESHSRSGGGGGGGKKKGGWWKKDNQSKRGRRRKIPLGPPGYIEKENKCAKKKLFESRIGSSHDRL